MTRQMNTSVKTPLTHYTSIAQWQRQWLSSSQVRPGLILGATSSVDGAKMASKALAAFRKRYETKNPVNVKFK